MTSHFNTTTPDNYTVADLRGGAIEAIVPPKALKRQKNFFTTDRVRIFLQIDAMNYEL